MFYLIIFIVILVIIGFPVLIYNSIIKLKNNREQAFGDIDVQLKNRYDLIPNLVETVKGYAAHEKVLLEEITKARTQAMNANGMDAKVHAENQLENSLKSILAIAENYPDLKANQNFLQLQTELSDIENKIAAARRYFNNATKEYNTAIQMFPNTLIAGLAGFKPGEFFDLGSEKAAAEKPVEVKL